MCFHACEAWLLSLIFCASLTPGPFHGTVPPNSPHVVFVGQLGALSLCCLHFQLKPESPKWGKAGPSFGHLGKNMNMLFFKFLLLNVFWYKQNVSIPLHLY